MKRRYMTPQTQVCKRMSSSILTTSSPIDGNASENARAPFFDLDDESEE